MSLLCSMNRKPDRLSRENPLVQVRFGNTSSCGIALYAPILLMFIANLNNQRQYTSHFYIKSHKETACVKFIHSLFVWCNCSVSAHVHVCIFFQFGCFFTWWDHRDVNATLLLVSKYRVLLDFRYVNHFHGCHSAPHCQRDS